MFVRVFLTSKDSVLVKVRSCGSSFPVEESVAPTSATSGFALVEDVVKLVVDSSFAFVSEHLASLSSLA